jgi:hypothetical protein
MNISIIDKMATRPERLTIIMEGAEVMLLAKEKEVR